ncbi:hypothetical protein D7V51_12985 [Acinetobacter cumulans]|nr:hypothetical protein D7V51_12985 [Acinetobacter cumulans]
MLLSWHCASAQTKKTACAEKNGLKLQKLILFYANNTSFCIILLTEKGFTVLYVACGNSSVGRA